MKQRQNADFYDCFAGADTGDASQERKGTAPGE